MVTKKGKGTNGSHRPANGKPANSRPAEAGTLTELQKALCIDKEREPDPAFALLAASGNPGRVVVAISDDQLGVCDEKHGADLLLIFLQGLCERVTLPDEIVFYHRGVFVLDKDHPALTILFNLCSQDVAVKACRESLDFYKKEPAVLKIQPVPMSEITRDLLKADRVVHP